MTISKDRVKPSPLPDSWKLKEIFATGVVLGTYLALMTVLFFWAAHKTDFFPVSVFIYFQSGFQIAGVGTAQISALHYEVLFKMQRKFLLMNCVS